MSLFYLFQTAPQTGAFSANLDALERLVPADVAPGAVLIAPAGAVEGGTGHAALRWDDVRRRRDEAVAHFAARWRDRAVRWFFPLWEGDDETSAGTFRWREVTRGEIRPASPEMEGVTVDGLAITTGLPEVSESKGEGLRLTVRITGAEDRSVFPGGTRAVRSDGRITQIPAWEEGVLLVDSDDAEGNKAEFETTLPPVADERYLALVTAIRSYVEKARAPGVVLGLSGGVDSALIVSLAVDALGAERVRTVMLPTDFTSSASLDDAKTLAENLGVRHEVLPIKGLFEATLATLSSELSGRPWDITEENLQARIRSLLLMAYANKNGTLLLCTSNKAEAAMGYGTLYGDIAGGFAPLCDLWKSEVYALCRARNAWRPDIPERILTRAPSAELRPGQKDTDSLPEYDVIQKTLDHYLSRRTLEGIEGVDESLAQSIVRRFLVNNFKRAQGIPGPILSRTPLSIAADWGMTRG